MFDSQTWYFLARCFIHFSLLLHFLMTVTSKSFQLFLFCYNTIGKVRMRTPFMKSWYEKNYGFIYADRNHFLHEIFQQKSREEVCIMQYNSVVSAIWERRGWGGEGQWLSCALRHGNWEYAQVFCTVLLGEEFNIRVI